MMSNEMLKGLISFKLKFMDKIIDKLPDSSKKVVKDMEKSFLSVIHDATKEYGEKENGEKNDKDIQPISIE